MEREIEFRGKTGGVRKWVYGHYYKHDGVSYICNENHADSSDTYGNDNVHDETIGQYTGLKDKNGVKIYEGDEIKITWKSGHETIEEVSYDEKYCYYKYGNNPICELIEGSQNVTIQVIGNIHENG